MEKEQKGGEGYEEKGRGEEGGIAQLMVEGRLQFPPAFQWLNTNWLI